MFVTPVLYPIDHLQGKTRLVAELNPLSSPIEMAKVGMIGAGSVRLFAAIWSIAPDRARLRVRGLVHEPLRHARLAA